MQDTYSHVHEVVDGSPIALIHYVGSDTSLPGSDVVEVIAPVPPDWNLPGATSFASATRLFGAHVFLRAGKTLDIWRKVGHQDVPTKPPQRWCTVPPEDLGRDESSRWRVWTTGGEMSPALRPSDLDGAELGYVMSPIQIVHRVRHGRYTLDLPRVAHSKTLVGILEKLFKGSSR